MADTPNTNTPNNDSGASNMRWRAPAAIPTTPIAPPGRQPVYPGEDISGNPTTPIAPPGGQPVFPGFGWPDFPIFPTPIPPSNTLFGRVRFLNASTSGQNLDVFINNRNVFSGSTFATVSTNIDVPDGFHTVTVRQTNGRVLYQQTLGFVSGENVTMVILDIPGGVTLAKVSDMGCTNVAQGFGCFRVANMSFNGSRYDVRVPNNQIVFSNVGFREVTSYKQAAAGNYTFLLTSSQPTITTIREMPVLLLTAITGGSCPSCTANNTVLTFNLNIQAGKSYTSYIIGNPWSNQFQVFTLED